MNGANGKNKDESNFGKEEKSSAEREGADFNSSKKPVGNHATSNAGGTDEICKPSVAYSNLNYSYYVICYECSVTVADVRKIADKSGGGSPSAMYLWFPLDSSKNGDDAVNMALIQFEQSHDEKHVEKKIREIFKDLNLENDPNKIKVCEVQFP